MQMLRPSTTKPSQKKIQKFPYQKKYWKIFTTFSEQLVEDGSTLFEQEGDYWKPVRVGNFWNNNYINYESNGDRNKKPFSKRIT